MVSIIARSGSRRIYGLDEQIRRLAAYKEAGVDVLWATSNDAETLRRHSAELTGPLWAVCNQHSGAQGRLRLGDQLAYHRPDWALLIRHVQFSAEELSAFRDYETVIQGESADHELKVTIVKRRKAE